MNNAHMNNSPGYSQPTLGATFYPGGQDDYWAPPEVISPLPQRSMPEVPDQIQQNLANFELEADSSHQLSGRLSVASMTGSHHSVGAGQNTLQQAQDYGAWDHSSGGQNQSSRPVPPPVQAPLEDQPNFSPFPPLHDRAANVPPSDDEKEGILENARVAVLNSNDPEMQLTWAQDALAFVEVAMQNEQRLSENQTSRSGTPKIEHQLRTDSINVVSFLADQHHPKAEFMRGLWLEFGKFGIRMDKKEAYRCYSRAAQGGYARAEYRMGMQFESSNEIAKAIKHYSMGVQAKDSASYYRLGMMTLLGQQGQPQDIHRGVEMIKFSAETADENAPQGAYVYGMLQARELPQVSVPEHDLPLNLSNALYNVEKAAYLGFAKAQTKMGAAYELSQLGCRFDPALSLHYNNLAARQGEPEAEMAISKWFLCGYDGVFQKSEKLAYEYAQRAAQSGLATAEFAMGYFCEIGINGPVNLKEARSWYIRAAEHGNKDASGRVEGISRSKTLSRKDHDKIAVAKINSGRPQQRRTSSRPHVVQSATMPTLPSLPAHEPISMPDPTAPHQGYGASNPYNSARPTSFNPSLHPSPFVSPMIPQNSSFGNNAPSRPTSAATMGGLPSNSQYTQPMAPAMGPQRPYSSSAGPGPGGNAQYGQPMAPAMGPQRPYSSSAGLGPGGRTNYGPGNQYGQQNLHPPASLPNTAAAAPLPYNNQQPLPPVNIGFMAPPDPSGADRKKRGQWSDHSYPPQQGGPPSRGGYGARPDRISSRMSAVSQPPNHDNPGRIASPHVPSDPATANRPPRHESMPQRIPVGGGHPAYPPQSPHASTPPPSSSGGNVSVASAAPSSAHPSRPPKGPATFEEMGVPQGKKTEDCIMM